MEPNTYPWMKDAMGNSEAIFMPIPGFNFNMLHLNKRHCFITQSLSDCLFARHFIHLGFSNITEGSIPTTPSQSSQDKSLPSVWHVVHLRGHRSLCSCTSLDMYQNSSVTIGHRTEANKGARLCCILTVHVADFAVLDCWNDTSKLWGPG